MSYGYELLIIFSFNHWKVEDDRNLKIFNPSLIFFQTIREKVARYNYSWLQIHQPTMEYYIYELFIRLT